MPHTVVVLRTTASAVWRDGGGRGKRSFSKTSTLSATALARTRPEGAVRTNTRLRCTVEWSDGQVDSWEPAWSTRPRGNRNRDDPTVSVFGTDYYVHRVVAFAFGNTPGVSFDDFCNAVSANGERLWHADHTNEDPTTIYSYALEVVTAEENRRRLRHRERLH